MTRRESSPSGASGRTVFIADVHLRPREFEKEQLLEGFLDSLRGPGNTLFILGDFFDLWVGPRHHGLGEYDRVLEHLRALSGSGARVYFLAGNRDFYGAEDLAEEIGAEFIPAPRIFELSGIPVYVAHGDLLCARDLRYRVGRFIVRNRLAQWFFLNFPLELSFFLAHIYRVLSRRLLAHTHQSIVTIVPEVAEAIFAEGADVIVSGHLHREQRRTFTVDGRTCRLFTLGDWNGGARYLELIDGTFAFRQFTPALHPG